MSPGPRSARLDAEAPDPAAHLEFAARHFGDPRIARWHWPGDLGGPRTREQVREILFAQGGQLERLGYCMWWWRERDTGELVGTAGLNPAEVEGEAVVEVGWSIYPDHHGRELAPEAARAAVSWGFGRCLLEHVYSFTMPANGPSRRVMEKLEMTYVREFERKGLPHLLYRLDAPRDPDAGSNTLSP